ncbi:MAG TPA: GDP-mannose 4,6-dehydratase [Actinomycetota bacterium]|nr:GDP-mannose 4,6-dehydratase [Actinomycetota bacterium]
MAIESALVTGAAGFVGSHLVEALLAQGVRVTAVVRRTSRSQILNDQPNLSSAVDNPRLVVLPVDVAGPSAVDVLASVDSDVWLHLAADAFVPASIEQPASVVLNNVTSTLNVLEAARRGPPQTIVVVSSSEVYGSHPQPIDEHCPLQPTTPYGASKAAIDRLAWTYHETFGVPVTIVRPFNCYGPRHVYDAVPIFIARAVAGAPLEVNGDGRQTRDLTYVDDTVRALIAIAATPAIGRVYNIGTGGDVAILDLARMIRQLAGSKSEIRLGPARRGEVRRLCADATRLREELAWEPTVSLEEGLIQNIDWYRSIVGGSQ